ncbi:MAG: endonuclease/exonuclease/phosphatase family protein [Acidobacteriota bacterium]
MEPAHPANARALDVRIATYNIHRCQGLDRRTRPERIAEILQEIDADIVALQEVLGPGPRGECQAQAIGALLGMGWVMAPTRRRRGHLLGNVVLSRFPIRRHVSIDLTCAAFSLRNCQRADLAVGNDDAPHATFHVYNVHLGTGILERRIQARSLDSFINDHRVMGPKVVLGDLNEWTKGDITTMLSRTFQSIELPPHAAKRGSYPGILPLVQLDHIYYGGRVEVRDVRLPRTRKALVASDHLPLVADLRVHA